MAFSFLNHLYREIQLLCREDTHRRLQRDTHGEEMKFADKHMRMEVRLPLQMTAAPINLMNATSEEILSQNDPLKPRLNS